MSGKVKEKNTKKIVLLIVFGVIAASLVVFTLFQWNNIRVLTYFLFYSDVKIADIRESNERAIAAAIDRMIPDISIRDLTEDEREKLSIGEISQEEAVRLLIGAVISVEASPSAQGEDRIIPPPPQLGEGRVPLPPPQGSNGSVSQERLAELLAEIYVLRAVFLSSLRSLEADAKAEYRALPSERRTRAQQLDIGMKYIGVAENLEIECDARMDELLAKIEAELRASGGDLSLITEIRSVYNNEKTVSKAEYLSLYTGF